MTSGASATNSAGRGSFRDVGSHAGRATTWPLARFRLCAVLGFITNPLSLGAPAELKVASPRIPAVASVAENFSALVLLFPNLHSAVVSVSFLLFVPFCVFVASVCVRRVHDFDFSGWWVLLLFPFYIIGGLALTFVVKEFSISMSNALIFSGFLFIGVLPGNKESNRFGLPPD